MIHAGLYDAGIYLACVIEKGEASRGRVALEVFFVP